MKTKVWFFGLAGVLFLLIVTYLIQGYIAAQEARVAPNFAPTETQQDLTNFALVVTVMVLGIVSSYIFEEARSAPGSTINLRAEIAKMASSSRFIMALVITPFIYNSIYLVIGNNPDSISDFILAFQNGFFWESVFEGVSKVRNSKVLSQPS